jgi:3-dehydrosphinganine reductase
MFAQKLALITGGSSGIGLALARSLAAQGTDVWILARDPERLEAALHQVRAAQILSTQKSGALSVDVSDRNQVTQVVGEFLEKTGTPDFLFNCAGAAHPGYFEKLDLEIFDWMIQVNYLGTVRVTKAVIPGMIQRRSGHVVNISSIAGFLGVFGYTAYGAAKFAVRGFSEALRAEMKPYGIRVSVVYPPDTDTAELAYENQFKPPETKAVNSAASIMSADQVAAAILKGVARGKRNIFPNFEGALYYRLGDLIYPFQEMIIARARRKLAQNDALSGDGRSRDGQGLGAEQHQGDPHQVGDQQVDKLHPNRGQ